MNRFGLSLFAALLLLGSVPLAQGQQSGTTAAPGAANARIVYSDHAVLKAKVEAIDSAERTVTLRGEQGREIQVKVGPEARNFDKLKVGDEVQADVYSAAVISLRKSNEPPSMTETDTVARAAPGGPPGGAAVDTMVITATVDAIDPRTRMITLTGPQGKARTFKVDDSVGDLDKVKKGDQVVLRLLEAVALSVNPR